MATLRVRDCDLVTDFYRDAIGLSVMQRTATGARLGAGGVPLLDLDRHAEAAIESPEGGGPLSRRLSDAHAQGPCRWLVYAGLNRIPLSGFADHRVSESVYLDDPEGNGIEVYADRAPELWQWNSGLVTMATDQLDIEDLLTLTDSHVSNYASAPDGLRIGHVHLRVGDLERADSFYRGNIGLTPTRSRNGAAFLSSGRYHHHLAVNVWQSAGAGRRDDTTTGLSSFTLEIAAQDMLQAQQARLRQAGAQVMALTNGIETIDPWGTRLRLIKI